MNFFQLGLLSEDGVEAYPGLTLVSPAVNLGSQSLKGILAGVLVSRTIEFPANDLLTLVLLGHLLQFTTGRKILGDAHRAASIRQVADMNFFQLGFLGIDRDKRQVARISAPIRALLDKLCKRIVVKVSTIVLAVITPIPTDNFFVVISFRRRSYFFDSDSLSRLNRSRTAVSFVMVEVNHNRQIVVVGNTVFVHVRSPYGKQSSVLFNSKRALYKFHRSRSFFGINQTGNLTLTPAEESSDSPCEIAAVLNCNSAAVLIGAARIGGHGAGGGAVAVVGHRVGGQTGDGGGFVAVNGQRLLLASHVVGQHGVAVGVVVVVAGKAVRPHVQGHLIGQGVGLGFILGILLRSGRRPVPGKSLSVLIDRHTGGTRQAAFHQLDVFPHGVHHSAGVGGGYHFTGDALKDVRQIIDIGWSQIVVGIRRDVV